ncbi:MAG: Outer membrane protein assembly factor BamB [Phycisphaerae bacterium]|nr:Outer membrane protein assembly factor BamB [Phycisphaerae bacterium]
MAVAMLAGTTAIRAQDSAVGPGRRDAYRSLYSGYVPDFVEMIRGRSGYGQTFEGYQRGEKEMKLSTESSFFTLNMVDEDQRANALVEAGLKKEADGQYREALKVYQVVIEKYPRQLYRISDYGVFVPVAQYCQRRILGFPPKELAHYRTLYDPRAQEAYEQARRHYSLIGLSEILDTMLATSYGGRATLDLGDAALDTGHYLAALEYYSTVRDFFPDRQLHTPELSLKIDYCRGMLGSTGAAGGQASGATALKGPELDKLRQVVQSARYVRPAFHSQLASAPNVACDDYTLLPPPTDPLGLKPPTWQHGLPGSRRDVVVYSQPVVTDNSIIYRHKNIVYCRSVLNGELRWQNSLGGRAIWQNRDERQYPEEDLLVQDGLVFTVVSKAGPSLVALDETTGQLRWAYGPMVAANEEQARMRFEAAPAGGPRTVYAGYVLDNIEGETHTDTEYGVMAFESTTGRLQWRTPVCTLAPGKFAGGFAEHRRNRIRSFTSPPLYHQGTVYYTTNAGAIAAMDALSGRIKWLIRYPYFLRPESVHDATRKFGELPFWSGLINTGGMHEPSFWFNQRPLLVGERLYVLPVDSPVMLCMDRRTGRVQWSLPKPASNFTYLLGPTREGCLVLASSGRKGMVNLLDPATGQTVWTAPDLILPESHPVVKYGYVHWGYTWISICDPRNYPGLGFYLVARPFLGDDDHLITTYYSDYGHPSMGPTWCVSLADVDLKDRKIAGQRRYYTAAAQAFAAECIRNAQGIVKDMESWLPPQDDNDRHMREITREIAADTVPVNSQGPFVPFSRVTFKRYGVPFELRFTPRSVQMVYDRAAVRSALAARSDPQSDFARAELEVADARYDQAAGLLHKCLDTISSEDTDFRAAINQQLFRVHERLARRAIRAGRPDEELANALGMGRTAGALAEEIETLFAVSEAFARQGKTALAAKALQTIISTYGGHEYPVSPVEVADPAAVLSTARGVIDRYSDYMQGSFFEAEMTRSLALMGRGLPLYLSTVSPLPRTLTVRAGELASARLRGLAAGSPELAKALQAQAASELSDKPPDEQLRRLCEFPGTPAAQRTLEVLLATATNQPGPAGRTQLWQLADVARVSDLTIPAAYRVGVLARAGTPTSQPAGLFDESVAVPQNSRGLKLPDSEGSARVVLERRGDRADRPELLFVGARIRRRLDNKFVVTAIDLRTGRQVWETPELRLKGTGQETGFTEAFVCGDRVVVHGLYDVLAFRLSDGALLWQYRVPFDFEIGQALLSGDLLVLSGKTETLALYVPSDAANGEVVWQVKEMGDVYYPAYMRGDRLISVRKLPFNVTERYRSTGQLIGRLDLPDLSLHGDHPLLENGPEALPVARCGPLLAVSDSWYYIVIDTDRLAVRWKRLIDNNDLTREPAMRFALSEDYLIVTKEDYDQKSIYGLDARTGALLWQSDPKDAAGPQPMYDVVIDGRQAYGIQAHPGQGFYLRAVDCRTGKLLFRTECKDYQARPLVRLADRLYGRFVVAQVADRQDFQVKAFDLSANGKDAATVSDKGVGPFGEPGRVSATVQAGRLILLTKEKLGL